MGALHVPVCGAEGKEVFRRLIKTRVSETEIE